MRAGIGVLTAVLLAASAAAPAQAQDEPGSAGSSVLTQEIVKYAKSMKLRLSAFEVGGNFDEAELGVGATAHLLVDPWARRGRVRLGAGREDTFALRLDAKIQYERGGAARTRITIDLSVGGTRKQIALPDVRLSTSDVYGERAYEATIPIIEGRW